MSDPVKYAFKIMFNERTLKVRIMEPWGYRKRMRGENVVQVRARDFIFSKQPRRNGIFCGGNGRGTHSAQPLG